MWRRGACNETDCNPERKNFVRGEKLFAAPDGVDTRRGL